MTNPTINQADVKAMLKATAEAAATHLKDKLEKDAEIKRLREQGRYLVAKLYCASGCNCCRDDENWFAAEGALGELFGVPRYADDSGYDWFSSLKDYQPKEQDDER